MFDVNSFNFDTPLDVIVCMNDEFMQRNFAINLVEVNHKIYEKTEGKVTGILLEKSKKKYYNIDIDIVIKALLITFKEELKDENKLAKIALMFMQDSSSKFKNLRLLVDFFSYIDLCPNSDKTYLYSSLLCESEVAKSFFVLNVIGFSKTKMIELLLDREMIGTLDDSADMIRSKTNVLAYGNKIKKVALEKNISMHKILEIREFVAKI